MSKFGGALKKLQAVQQDESAGKTGNPETRKPENPKSVVKPLEFPKGNAEETRKPESLNSGDVVTPLIEREKYSTYLDSELVTALKLYAVRHKMKHHHVVEAALRAYLKEQS